MVRSQVDIVVGCCGRWCWDRMWTTNVVASECCSGEEAAVMRQRWRWRWWSAVDDDDWQLQQWWWWWLEAGWGTMNYKGCEVMNCNVDNGDRQWWQHLVVGSKVVHGHRSVSGEGGRSDDTATHDMVERRLALVSSGCSDTMRNPTKRLDKSKYWVNSYIIYDAFLTVKFLGLPIINNKHLQD